MTQTSEPTRHGGADWVQLALSSSGRMGRAPFLIVGAVTLAAFFLYDDGVRGLLRLMTGWAVYLLLIFVSGCILSKRLHDRGRSGWWAALILWAFAVVLPSPRGLIDALCLAVLVWAVVELGAMPGEPGANRFGPPPAF